MKSDTSRKLISWITSSLTVSAAVSAGQLTATIEIPQLNVAEYHRPYIAAWVESEDRSIVANLSVWYDTEMADKEGETWLKDIRQWWRKSGRSLNMPVDGVSGPTRPVGKHTFSADLTKNGTTKLNTGSYYFVVEASREVGGREIIQIPFTWSNSATINSTTSGERELGEITLKISQ